MTRLEDPTHIEQIVSTPRFVTQHIGRAVSAEERLYILHSQVCLDTGVDLRDCAFSIALDRGMPAGVWNGWQDVPVVLAINPTWGYLVPLSTVDLAPERSHCATPSRGPIEQAELEQNITDLRELLDGLDHPDDGWDDQGGPIAAFNAFECRKLAEAVRYAIRQLEATR